MMLTITSVDYAPEELHSQVPIKIDLIRMMPGDDRPDYWLGKAETPIVWMDDNTQKNISHVIVAARWDGTKISDDFKNLPVGLAFVTDPDLLEDTHFYLRKASYVAIGMAYVGDEPTNKVENIMSGHIAPAFGLAKRKANQTGFWARIKQFFSGGT